MIARFHVPPATTELRVGATVELPTAVAHHAVQVLRLRAGDELMLFDGQGGEYAARLVVDGRRLLAEILTWHEVERESPLRLALLQALPSGDKMDWVVQKAVELGAHALQPLASQRSVLRLAGERRHKRELHWQQVAQAACEQSGRNRLMVVQPLQELATWLAQPAPAAELRLLLCPHQGVSLGALPRPGVDVGVSLLVGPEGGFTEAEEALAVGCGFQRVRLGPRVLRTETAGLAALAALQVLWGDLG